MGDFPPPERTSVTASELIHRAVDKSYEDFRSLMYQLPNLKEEERREPLLKHLLEARKRFAQLLVVLKWSVQSPLVEQCQNLLEQAQTYRNQINETNDRMFFMHADLNRAKERRYDLSTAVDVLYGGSYLRLPSIIPNAMFPRELPPVDTQKFAQEVDDIIRFRLIETEIPVQFTKIHVENAFVTCEVEGEFEIVLTIQGKESDSLWHVISVRTALSDTKAFDSNASQASSSSLHIIKSNTPNDSHYAHLRNLVQRAMNESDKPFVNAFYVMREFCSCLALQILFAQGKLLMEGHWRNRLSVKYHRNENVLDFCYWSSACVKKDNSQTKDDRQRLLAQIKEARLQEATDGGQANRTLPPLPEASLCVRLSFDETKRNLLQVTLNPILPPHLSGKTELLKKLQVPSNMYLLSAEALLLNAMKAHVSSALFAVERLIVVDELRHQKENTPIETRLVTGESVTLINTRGSLRISRSDIGGLQQFLEIMFDIREGRFVVKCVAAAKSPILAASLTNLEKELNNQCKIEISSSALGHSSSVDFALGSNLPDKERSLEAVHAAVRKALCEILAYEITAVGLSLKRMEVYRHVNLNWDRYVAFRQQQGAQITDLSISDTSLFFQLTSSKESTCYLVIEIDKYAELDGNQQAVAASMGEEVEEYVRLPCFSLLQTSGSSSSNLGQGAGVQFIQRFPAFKKNELHPSVYKQEEYCSAKNKKRRVSNDSSAKHNGRKEHPLAISKSHNSNHSTPFQAVLLHVIGMCHDRIQLQHFVNFARRRKSRIRYSGEAATSAALANQNGKQQRRSGTGGQVVTLSFPDKVHTDPLMIGNIQGHLRPNGGFDLCLQLIKRPFTFIFPSKAPWAEKGDAHFVNDSGHLVFRYPYSPSFAASSSVNPMSNGSMSGNAAASGIALGELLHENPLEMFMVELVCVVKPLCELAVKLEKMLMQAGRYTNHIKDDGYFYVERADPFAIVLACRWKNPRAGIIAAGEENAEVIYRVTIQFKQKMGFVVSYSHKAEHPLMHFIQSALNGHGDPAQLIEALERTCIPMGILASVVESQLLCAKYYRHEPPAPSAAEANGGAKAFGRGNAKGGKGMKLGYKCKLPGEEKGYYAEKSYGGDDKSFVPADLVLIPRSQTHLRLSYADRCAVDIYFLENHRVKIQSSSAGVRVPSCPADTGLTVDFLNFGEKLRSLLSEMASL